MAFYNNKYYYYWKESINAFENGNILFIFLWYWIYLDKYKSFDWYFGYIV